MKKFLGFITMLLLVFVTVISCGPQTTTSPTSSSGVKKATAKVITQSNGLTVEQNNIKERLTQENMPGVIKHLYVISAMSGQVIIYSTIKGKITSSGKRLTSTVSLQSGDRGEWTGDFPLPNIQDDGTYGTSIPYLYWWDTNGKYHQHYVSGGQILHVSDKPMPVKEIVINLSN